MEPNFIAGGPNLTRINGQLLTIASIPAQKSEFGLRIAPVCFSENVERTGREDY
jgi:hypothetical protein